MSLLTLKPTSGRVNYLLLAVSDKRSFPESERRSREIIHPVNSSLPRGIKSDKNLPYPIIPLIFTITMSLYLFPGKGWGRKDQKCHIWRVPSTLKETSRTRKNHSPPSIRFHKHLPRHTWGACDWCLLMVSSYIPSKEENSQRFCGNGLRLGDTTGEK